MLKLGAIVFVLVVAGGVIFLILGSLTRASSKESVKSPDYKNGKGTERGDSTEVKVPKDIDEQGIRKIVEQLLNPKTAGDAEAKLALLGERAVPALVGAISDPRFSAKPKKAEDILASAPLERVLDLLQPFGPHSAAKPLSVLASNQDEYFRKTAALALGNIASDDCIEPMKLALSDSADYVRSYTMMGIGWARNLGHGTPAFFDAMFEPVSQLLNRKDSSLSQAPEILLELNQSKAVEAMLQPEVFNLANPILYRVLSALNKKNVEIPAAKLYSLMNPIRNSLGEHPNEAIFGESLIALARTADPGADAQIQRALESPNNRVAESAAMAMMVQKGLSDIMGELFKRLDEQDFDHLTPPEKVILSVTFLENEVNNGGFDQFFFNSSGDHAADALSGLKVIKASATAQLLDTAIQLFGSKGPSADRNRRMAQLEKFSSRAETKFSELDEKFFKDPDRLQLKLRLYIAENSAALKSAVTKKASP